MRRLLFVALLAATASSCALLNQLLGSAFKKPTLTFRSAQLADASLAGATVNLTYALHNPNPLGLSLASVSYALFVEGKQVVAGAPPKGLQVGAQRTTDLTFPAAVKFAELAPVLQVFLSKDRARYRAEGTIGVQTPLGVLSFPLSHEADFEVPKIPNVELSSPRIAQLSLTSATVELPLTVTNRNSFALPIGDLSGAVQIAGANVGTVSAGALGTLPGGTPRMVTLPFTVNFGSALAAANALRRGSGTVAFNGQLQSGGASIPLNLSQTVTFRR
jgi:LEA14-like dessication related protein